MAANSPIWKGTTSLTETPRSGVMKYAERITYFQEFEGPIAAARTFADNHYRGTIWTISYLGASSPFIVEDCTVTQDRAGKGTIQVNYTYLYVLPPDEWSVTPFEINPPTERHDNFSSLTDADLRRAKASFTAATAQGQTSIDAVIGASANASLIQTLVNKWLLGQETFYMSGLKYQWSVYAYSLTAITLRRGGYRETPGGPGAFPDNFVWLRQGDEVVWNNGMYKVTRSWVGAPDYAGGWDEDIYGTTPI
jgi:hypothetical protein